MPAAALPSTSPEIRQDKVTGDWVIYSPSRGKRPSDFRQDRGARKPLPPRDENCPFCPGNEDHLEKILLEMPNPVRGTWCTRAIPNKFPALVPEGSDSRDRRGIYLAMPGYGRHEVIIESPVHSQQLARMPPAEVEMLLETYQRRYVDLMREHRNMLAIIFRNHGERAGTSLLHPHSQIIVTGIVPGHIRAREEAAQRHFDQWGRCVYCEILEFEIRDRNRLLLENESFIAFVPFAATVPFETWIVPRRHAADFGSISDGEKADLAQALREVLGRLYERLGDPDYNYVIASSARYRADEPQLHWYLQIRPRLTTWAGFEIGSGISINPSTPEADAAFLR